MNFRSSLAFFGLPGLAMFLGVYLALPALIEAGTPLIAAVPLVIWGPLVAMTIWVFTGYVRARPPDQRLSERFRLKRIPATAWIAMIVGFVAIQALELLLSGTADVFIEWPLFSAPPVLPELFDPAFDPTAGMSQLFGVPLQGNWWLIGYWLGWVIVNIGTEEFLWRGYALPLQEQIFGRYAWLINGLMWNVLIHLFMRWNVVALMPISLLAPYLAQRYQNTWIAVFLHGIGNLLFLVVLIPGIIGT